MSRNNNFSLFLIICILGCISIAQGLSTLQLVAWCVPEKDAEKGALQEYLNFACLQLGPDCEPIQPGKECFDPPTLLAHAGYVMAAYFHKSGECPNFAHIVHTDPSYGACKYPSRPE